MNRIFYYMYIKNNQIIYILFTIPRRRLELNNLTWIGFFPIWLFGIGIETIPPSKVGRINSSGGIDMS